MHSMRQLLCQLIFRHVLPVILKYTFRKKPISARRLTLGLGHTMLKRLPMSWRTKHGRWSKKWKALVVWPKQLKPGCLKCVLKKLLPASRRESTQVKIPLWGLTNTVLIRKIRSKSLRLIILLFARHRSNVYKSSKQSGITPKSRIRFRLLLRPRELVKAIFSNSRWLLRKNEQHWAKYPLQLKQFQVDIKLWYVLFQAYMPPKAETTPPLMKPGQWHKNLPN